MSRASVKLASIRKRFPRGTRLPPEFRDALNVVWSDASGLLNVPKDGAEHRVVFHDSEGRHGVLALSFRDFVARLGKPSAAFRERVELDQDLDTSMLAARVKPKVVPGPGLRQMARSARQVRSGRALACAPAADEELALSVVNGGSVYADRGNELTLEP